ncbi:hypothetical protein SLEP1_g59235 [Rubroshorea leprosula]|uniref:Uncharacterized protein n=1 Tax=Rubroshorea leprosula TaxID=152421 RepID=A0AAV5MUJ6_9ROSI|nr:hypothetical protein SLEP1_g59235 [Rubroshorea leprosula]
MSLQLRRGAGWRSSNSRRLLSLYLVLPRWLLILLLGRLVLLTHARGKSSTTGVRYPEGYSFATSSSRTAARHFIEATFPEMDLIRARDEVDLHGGDGVVRHILEGVNLVNALANNHLDSLKERNKLVKEKEELSKQKEDANKNVESLTSELDKLRDEVAMLKKALPSSQIKREKLVKKIFPRGTGKLPR